jgi:IS4 transposase
VIKVVLDGGEIETLITNVNKKYLPYGQARELYFKRWRIEEKFRELKE